MGRIRHSDAFPRRANQVQTQWPDSQEFGFSQSQLKSRDFSYGRNWGILLRCGRKALRLRRKSCVSCFTSNESGISTQQDECL